MSYTRVLPRDLFNEAKLLKCLGRLSLLIHDGMAPDGLELLFNDRRDYCFDTHQRESDGGLLVANVGCWIGDDEIWLHSVYNSKDNYPLYFECGDDSDRVFCENGKLSAEFVSFCAKVKGGAT